LKKPEDDKTKQNNQDHESKREITGEVEGKGKREREEEEIKRVIEGAKMHIICLSGNVTMKSLTMYNLLNANKSMYINRTYILCCEWTVVNTASCRNEKVLDP
jgi:shikimate kinase